MLRAIMTAFLLAAAVPALAQQPAPPPFEPFQVDEQLYTSIMTYLADLPAKYANPLLATLTERERQAAKAKADAAAKPATPSAPAQ
jgi:hypothetical protein